MAFSSFDTSNLPTMPTFSSEGLLRKFTEYVGGSSWKFVNINFKRGLEELKRKVAGQMSDKDAEKLFVDLFSNDVNVIYNDVKKLNFQLPRNGGVFYSGMKGKKAAWLYARNIGSKAIEQTRGGSLFEYWNWFNDVGFKVKYWGKPSKGNDQAIVWSALSKAYAQNASGVANVFQEYEGNIWKNYEKPTLLSKNVDYEVHKINSSTNVISLVENLLR